MQADLNLCCMHMSRGMFSDIVAHLVQWIAIDANLMFISACQNYCNLAGLSGAVRCTSDWRPGGRGFDTRQGRQHSFVEIDHEIFSTVILSLQLIQEGQLSVSGERMCTILVNCLED